MIIIKKIKQGDGTTLMRVVDSSAATAVSANTNAHTKSDSAISRRVSPGYPKPQLQGGTLSSPKPSTPKKPNYSPPPTSENTAEVSGTSYAEPTIAYKIGYGKPPINSRFKLGQSGNPKGKSKESKNFKTILTEELDVKIEVTENGRKIKASKRELIVKTMVNKAAKGDHKAATEVFRQEDKLQLQSFGNSKSAYEDAHKAPSTLSVMDKKIIEYFGLEEFLDAPDTANTGPIRPELSKTTTPVGTGS
ncbi:MAG: DUF5681 domain-containing protein [Aestuariivirga sp.]